MSATCEALMYRVLAVIDEINSLASKLDGHGESVFGKLSLKIPRLAPPELGFLRSVSWLYVIYFEEAKPNVQFLSRRFGLCGVDPQGIHVGHLEITKSLRTYLQHNVNPSTPHNRRVQKKCQQWFSQHCKTSEPSEDAHWEHCLAALLNGSVSFLGALQKCVRCIEQDEERTAILEEWRSYRTRNRSRHEFDKLISVAAGDMGRDALDPVRIRERFYDVWMKQLALLRPDFDFESEARKLIEHTLLSETAAVLPLTGKDIIENFEVAPGPEVGQLLQRARALYTIHPCSREELLGRLRLERRNGSL